MEFAFRGRQTMATADDFETGRLRRFPDDLPPPQHGDANASQVDAALARRREELLWELDKVRIRQDTIFRELVLTEHAMGINAAGHNPVPTHPSSLDYWRYRPSPLPVPPLEESPLHPPRSSTERSPCGCRGPAPVKETPLYPYVEWPPPRPASDTEKQQDSRSPGARTHPFDGHVELCPSPKKQTPADEASLPAAANAAARPTFHEEATPGHKDAACGERKADVVDGHGGNLLSKSGNQNNGQRTTAETTPVDQINRLMLQSGNYKLAGTESAAFDQQKGRAFSEPKAAQPQQGNGDKQKARVHDFNSYMELRLSPSSCAPVEETLVPAAAKASISPTQSAPSFGKETATEQQQAFGEPKDGHGMQPLGDIRNQSSGQRKAMESSKEGQTDKSARSPGQHRPAGLENAAYIEQKNVEFSEPKPVQPLGNGDAFNGYMELRLSPSKHTPVEETLVPAAAKAGISPMQPAPSFNKDTATGQQQAFGEPKANAEDGHGMQPLGDRDISNQSSGQRKAMESSMEVQTDKPARSPGQHRPAGQENAAHNEQKVEFCEPKPVQPQLGNGDEQKVRLHVFNDYTELRLSPSKHAPVEETLVPAAAKGSISPMQSAPSFGKKMATRNQRAFGGEIKAIAEDGHGIQPLGDIRNQSSGHSEAMESFILKVKAMESAMEGRTVKPAQSPGEHWLAGQENAAYNEQRKVEFNESTPERISYGLKRKLEDSAPFIKKQKPDWQWSCHTCDVTTSSQHCLEEHLAGQRHRIRVEELEELQSSRSDTAEPSTKAKPVWDRIAAKNTESSRGNVKENAAENRWSQQQRGNRPRAWLNSFNHRNDADTEKKADWKDKWYCNLCDARCNSEKMLASHLGGRRHRERMEESD
ncbi:unnamed protein product [Urochloa decumbens]|uniref:C2H2-type domain-containing protein n=1 Tax=Urochloa decumbens TaxID=240449 RepID=A0ABC9G606_9POAL